MEQIEIEDQRESEIKTVFFEDKIKCKKDVNIKDKEDADELDDANTDDDADDEYVSFFETLSPEEISDLEEFTHQFFDDYVSEYAIEMSDPDFKHNMCVELTKHLYYDMNWLDICDADHIPELRDWIDYQCDLFFDFADIPQRQQPYDEDTQIDRFNIIEAIEYIKSIPQIKQRTQEWYDERDNMITASSVWKIFASDAQRNSLIYEKCSTKHNSKRGVSLGISQNPMQWGAKYEPITRDLYSQRHGVKVEEYGCIPHPQYPFLGASPDGISETGRMVEIKNIVNREITGEPLEAYWIQMQIQMEVCGIDVCDFVETRFKEFDSERAFYESEDSVRGVILHFIPQMDTYDSGSEAEYVYYPLDLNLNIDTLVEWTEKAKEERPNSVLYYTYYWRLDEYSECVVKRNRLWFESAIPEIEYCWKTIVKERETGFGHRAPTSKKEMSASLVAVANAETSTDTTTSFSSHIVNCALPKQFMNIVKMDHREDVDLDHMEDVDLDHSDL